MAMKMTAMMAGIVLCASRGLQTDRFDVVSLNGVAYALLGGSP